LQKKLIKLVGFFTILAILVSLFVVFGSKFILSQSWLSSLLFATACLVAIIPQNLLACHDIALYTAAKKLAAKKVILNNLGVLDKLGFCSCLCLDKTGTLTQNKLTVEHIWLGGSIIRTVNKQKAEK
jgi:P-type E1-E2 ATPase